MDNSNSKTTQSGKTTFIINDITNKFTQPYLTAYLIRDNDSESSIRVDVRDGEGVSVSKLPTNDYTYHSTNYNVRVSLGTTATPTLSSLPNNSPTTAQGEVAYSDGQLSFAYEDPITGHYSYCLSHKSEAPATFTMGSEGVSYTLSDGSTWNYQWSGDNATACHSLEQFFSGDHTIHG